MTHCRTLRSVRKTWPSVRRATFTTVLSMMTMNVPRIRAMSGPMIEVVFNGRLLAGGKARRPLGPDNTC
jgi:hypothetical protein